MNLKKKRNEYLFVKIFLPLLLLIILFLFFNLSNFKFMDTISISGIFEYKPSPFLIKNVKFLASTFILIVIMHQIKKSNKEKEFLPTQFYGDIPYFIYYIASKIMGYGKINLQNKPYYIQFKIILHNLFEIIRNEEAYPNKNLEYRITEYVNKERKRDSYNLIVADTYPITMDQIPLGIRNNITILIQRKSKDKGRYYSDNLIAILEEKIFEIKNVNVPINLFLCTNPKTTQILIEKAFKTGYRDKFTLKVYQQNLTDSNKCFKKYKTIKF